MNKAMTREPSKDAWILCFFLSMIFAVSLILIPLILANGKPSNKSNNVSLSMGQQSIKEFVAPIRRRAWPTLGDKRPNVCNEEWCSGYGRLLFGMFCLCGLVPNNL